MEGEISQQVEGYYRFHGVIEKRRRQIAITYNPKEKYHSRVQLRFLKLIIPGKKIVF